MLFSRFKIKIQKSLCHLHNRISTVEASDSVRQNEYIKLESRVAALETFKHQHDCNHPDVVFFTGSSIGNKGFGCYWVECSVCKKIMEEFMNRSDFLKAQEKFYKQKAKEIRKEVDSYK